MAPFKSAVFLDAGSISEFINVILIFSDIMERKAHDQSDLHAKGGFNEWKIPINGLMVIRNRIESVAFFKCRSELILHSLLLCAYSSCSILLPCISYSEESGWP